MSVSSSPSFTPVDFSRPLQVAAATLVTVGAVWDALEGAARVVGHAAAETTIEAVDHRFGDEAASATQAAMAVGADLGNAALNVNRLGTKALVTRTAAETAKKTLVGDDHLRAAIEDVKK